MLENDVFCERVRRAVHDLEDLVLAQIPSQAPFSPACRQLEIMAGQVADLEKDFAARLAAAGIDRRNPPLLLTTHSALRKGA